MNIYGKQQVAANTAPPERSTSKMSQSRSQSRNKFAKVSVASGSATNHALSSKMNRTAQGSYGASVNARMSISGVLSKEGSSLQEMILNTETGTNKITIVE